VVRVDVVDFILLHAVSLRGVHLLILSVIPKFLPGGPFLTIC
jgi:hypothetical protein